MPRHETHSTPDTTAAEAEAAAAVFDAIAAEENAAILAAAAAEETAAREAAAHEAGRLAERGAETMLALEGLANELIASGTELHVRETRWAEDMKALMIRFHLALKKLP